jgi:hypothetical protein
MFKVPTKVAGRNPPEPKDLRPQPTPPPPRYSGDGAPP